MTAREGDHQRLLGDRLALAVLLLGALVRLAFFVEVATARVDLRSRLNVDCYMYDRLARRITGGDPWLRERYDFAGDTPDEPGHPKKSAPIQILGLERYERTYGPHAFFDSPGYAYFVAAIYSLFGPETYAVYFIQLALDLLACALLYLTALRVHDRTVARVALGLAALASPLVFHAGFLLRDSLLTSLVVLLLHAALRVQDARRPWLAALATGAVFGLAWLVKGVVLPLVPFVALATLARDSGGRIDARRSAGRWGALLLGAALAVLPLAARNVAFGVPPLRMTTGDVSSLILFNSPHAGTQKLVLNLDEARRTAALCPELTATTALRTAIAQHASTGAWLRLVLARVANLWVADDPWDNVRPSYLVPCLRSLAIARVRWKLVAPFALLGIVLVFARPRERFITLAPLFMVTVVTALGCCVTRYRLNAEPYHFLLAASGLVWLVRRARARDPRALVAALAALAVTFPLHDPEPPPTPERIEAYVAGTFAPGTATHLLENLRRGGW